MGQKQRRRRKRIKKKQRKKNEAARASDDSNSDGDKNHPHKKSNADRNSDECVVCEDGGDLICCDDCSRAYHLGCCNPVLVDVPGGRWACQYCLPSRPSPTQVLAPSPPSPVAAPVARASDERGNSSAAASAPASPLRQFPIFSAGRGGSLQPSPTSASKRKNMCGICGVIGHNSRRCRARMPVPGDFFPWHGGIFIITYVGKKGQAGMCVSFKKHGTNCMETKKLKVVLMSVIKGPYISPEDAAEAAARENLSARVTGVTGDESGQAAGRGSGRGSGRGRGRGTGRGRWRGRGRGRGLRYDGIIPGASEISFHPSVQERYATAPPDPTRPVRGRPAITPDQRDVVLAAQFKLQQASLARVRASQTPLSQSAPPLGSDCYGVQQYKCTLGIDNVNVPYQWLKDIKTYHLDTDLCVRGLGCQEVGTDRRANQHRHDHVLTEVRAPPGEQGCEMMKAHFRSFLKMPAGVTRGMRIQVKTLDCVSQSFKCWAGYAQKQKGDIRGQYLYPNFGAFDMEAVGGIDHRHSHNNRPMRELWFSSCR